MQNTLTASHHHFSEGARDVHLDNDSTGDEVSPADDMLFTPPELTQTTTIGCMTDVLQPSGGMRVEVDIWSTIHEFFNTMYIIFPIVSYTEISLRLIETPDWSAVPDLRTLLLSLRLLNAAGQYRMDSQNETCFRDLIRQVESSRLDYDFADPATLDAVVCSLFLFAAYNVIEKHGRAFLYLEEAASILEAVVPADDEETRRKVRLQQVLFNTEAATMKIYGDRSRQRKVPLPPLDAPTMTDHAFNREPESVKVAVHLLRRLTEINLAQDADALEDINVESEPDVGILYSNVLRQQHRYSRIQAADVVLTRQWHLSTKLAAQSRPFFVGALSRSAAVERLGLVAMSWVCLLREGELRVVGLGKLAGLANNLSCLAGPTLCRSVLGGLAGAISREDHEKNYAPSLARILMPLMSSIPSNMSMPDGESSARAHLVRVPDAETFRLDGPQLQFDVDLDFLVGDNREDMDFDRFIDLS